MEPKCLESCFRNLFLNAVLPNPLVLTRSSQNIEMFTAKGHTSLKVPVKLVIQSDNTKVIKRGRNVRFHGQMIKIRCSGAAAVPRSEPLAGERILINTINFAQK